MKRSNSRTHLYFRCVKDRKRCVDHLAANGKCHGIISTHRWVRADRVDQRTRALLTDNPICPDIEHHRRDPGIGIVDNPPWLAQIHADRTCDTCAQHMVLDLRNSGKIYAIYKVLIYQG